MQCNIEINWKKKTINTAIYFCSIEKKKNKIMTRVVFVKYFNCDKW